MKQQYGVKIFEEQLQNVFPPNPPMAQIHPLVFPQRSLAFSQTRQDPSEIQALPNPPALPLHGTPGRPNTIDSGRTAIVFLLYAPVLPGIPWAQQQLQKADPAAPHTSITAIPQPGEFQHHCVSVLTQAYIPLMPVTEYILPLGKFS